MEDRKYLSKKLAKARAIARDPLNDAAAKYAQRELETIDERYAECWDDLRRYYPAEGTD